MNKILGYFPYFAAGVGGALTALNFNLFAQKSDARQKPTTAKSPNQTTTACSHLKTPKPRSLALPVAVTSGKGSVQFTRLARGIRHCYDVRSTNTTLPFQTNKKRMETEEENEPKEIDLNTDWKSDAVAKAVEMALPIVVTVDVPSDSFLGCYGGRSGSGFIVSSTDKRALIVTNFHVVGDGRAVTIKLSDNTELRGRVLCSDSTTDLALIEAKTSEKVPVAVPGDASKVRAGEWVVTIGNSEGCLHNSVSLGIVSSAQRFVKELKQLNWPDEYESELKSCVFYVQTDAGVHPGNSGGPLINLKGEVIAVNTMTLNPGLNLSIPVSEVQRFLGEYEAYMATEKPKKPDEDLNQPIFNRHKTETPNFWNRSKI